MACLNSLKKTGYSNYEIILVDNASSDDSVSAIRSAFPEVMIIENKTNLGVAGGRNVGLKFGLKRGPDYILFLDNDTTVHEDFLREMVKVGENDTRAGILTGKIYFHSEPNKIWCAGGRMSFYRCKFNLIGYDELDRGQYEETKEVDYVTGCMFMIKRKVIDEIGVLDEDFVQYFAEDVDWCMRAKKKGYKIMYAPRAKAWHRVVKKTTVSERYWYLKGRNLFLFMRKHAQIHHWIFFSFFFIASSLKVFFREIIAGNLNQFFIMAKGTLSAFKIKK